MKKTIFILSVILLCLTHFSNRINAQTIYLYSQDNTQQQYETKEIRSLTFKNKSLNINKVNGELTTIPFVDLKKMVFKLYNSVRVPQLNSLFSIYPNPVSDIFRISYKGDLKSRKLNVRVLALDGRKVYEQKLDTDAVNNHEINVSDWKSGVYTPSVVDKNKQIFTKKFIKK